jgi:hypothetical protein
MRLTPACLFAGLPVFWLWMAAAVVAAQQQTNTPPLDQNSPLVQPAGVVQSGCPQPLAHRTPGSTVSSGDWVELERTGCHGVCSDYRVRLYGNGTVNWHGEHAVAVAGDAGAQVDAGAAANLIQQLRDHGFASLCGGYTRPIADSPTYLTTVNVSGTAYRVSDHAGSAPAWLRDFDDRVDAVADTHRWRHGEPSTEVFGAMHLVEDARFPKPGRTRLMRAAATSDGAIQLLLAQKVAVDAEDASGWTALMYAAGDGSLDQVRQLLGAGASAAHVSRAGETLLFAAAGSAENPVGKLGVLQKAGANAAAVSGDGTTVLMIAASRYWQPGVLKAVLELGVNPSVRNGQGKTALDVLEQARVVREVPGAYEAARAMLMRAR